MATQVQFRGGTTAQNSAFTGASKELTVDTDKDVVVVHDGSTAGGHPLMAEDGSNSALSLGSAGTPALKFTDSDTGIYSPGADKIALSTGGTGRLFIDGSNIGVNTSQPAARLHVRADGNEPKALLYLQNRDAGANAGGQIAFTNSLNDLGDNRLAYIRGISSGAGQNGNHLTFGTNANGSNLGPVERMRIKSNGTINISDVTGHASDTAAGQAGLTSGDVYKTSNHASLPDGVLMIKS